MYELWIRVDGYIEGKKLSRASKSVDLLQKRASDFFEATVEFCDELNSSAQCIWVQLADSKIPIGLIKRK
jgi:hypothetical protein